MPVNKQSKKAQCELDELMGKLVADSKNLKPPQPSEQCGLGEPVSESKLCPYQPKGCLWVGSYRCTSECEFHPENYNIDKEVLEQFEAEPWSVYCLTCGEFLDSRYGHDKKHVIATGIAEYREKIPEFVLERIKAHNEETGDMSW